MHDDVSDIAAFYDADPDAEDARLAEHPLEFDVTWRHLEEHLPPGARVLEVGAATGRYTTRLAAAGHSVTAVDLSVKLIAALDARVAAEGLGDRVVSRVADARDLSGVPGDDFDAVLLMGPLYHLVDRRDRDRALAEAHRRLRRGGVLVTAMLSRFGVLSDLLRDRPDWITDPSGVGALLELGSRPPDAPPGGFRGYFADPAEISPLHEEAGFTTVAVVGAEPVIGADDDAYASLTGEVRERWLDLLVRVGSEPSILGASRHLLYIGRREE